MKKLSYSFIALLALLFISSTSLNAQTVILSDQFDSGDGLWTSGWIDGATTVAVSIDTNSVLSGKNSYLIDVTNGGDNSWQIQRNADAPLVAGNLYTVSFLAVADTTASFNVLLEIDADPWTKRLNEWPEITKTPQLFSYTVPIVEDVPSNELKLHFGGSANNGVKFWVDSIVVSEEVDPAPVGQWGLVQEYKSLWPILNNAETGVGDGSIGGEALSGWRGIQGGFSMDLTVATDAAVVVTGQLEFAGGSPGENAYTPIRYALTYQDSSELVYQYTDSAQWSGSGHHYGYGFHPRTGTGAMSNGNGGVGTVWTINDGNWASTWSNNGGPIAAVNQAPRNANMVAGTYDFAISVHAVDDTTNEIRWYMVEQNNMYWFGGTAVDTATAKTFNSIIIGVDQFEGTAVNLSSVRAELGDPITVPEAPWESYYVDQWGLVQEYKSLWPILNDTLTLVGDASMGGEALSGWRGIQGGFGQDVNISTERAVIVTGQIEFAGGNPGENAYTPIRYAMTYQDSSELLYQFSDSAQWSGSGHHYGYGFHPRTGTGAMSNGNGGVGTVWTINDGNWASTWSNNGGPIAAVNQAPRNANMVAGTYDFAVSVHAIDDTTNEIRWYMVEEDNKYWFGGTAVDTAVSKKFNSIIFGVDQFEGTAFNVLEMEVDLGDPITVPEAPWESYYVDQWGLVQEYKSLWPILNDTLTLVGDASMGGEALSGWRGIQGGFGQDVSISSERAVIVTGQIEFAGGSPGENAYTPIRYALTFQDSTELLYQFSDSAQWSGSGHHYGYGFHPRTGTGAMSNGNGGVGTVWTINNGNWASTWSNNGGPIAAVSQAPRNANMVAGTYDFAVSVHAVDETTNEINWYMVEEDEKYWFGGTAVDTAVSKKFNSIIFGVDQFEGTAFNVLEMEVDLGDPIEIPKAPWADYYVDNWGIIDNRGGWDLVAGEFVGNADFGGDAPNDDVAAVRGGFESISLDVGEAFVVEGSIEFVNGGFDANTFRFGLFNGDAGSAAIDSVADSNVVWTGDGDGHSGYLFLPQSGAADAVGWANGSDLGTWGAVSDAPWYQSSGANNHAVGNTVQTPTDAVAGAGTYDFQIQVEPKEEGAADVTFTLWNSDKSYNWQAKSTDASAPTTTFNNVAFALGTGNTTTAMNLMDVQLKLRNESIVDAVEELAKQLLPTKFSLRNYPNPFNPSTTIEIALPQASKVDLVVYDLTGRLVAELAKNVDYNSGYHQITFDASNLASGLYFYKLEAGDYVMVKKLMLLK